MHHDYDYVIIGSGFGGSVSALRLSGQGYNVLVLEQGKWYKAGDFPKSNWNLPRWLWMPGLRFFGIMKIAFFRHITVLAGAGVGGGSLVYANTLPVPAPDFFKTGSWKNLADWQTELAPFYEKAKKMLGVARNPRLFEGELALEQLAREIGREAHFSPAEVGVFFGEPGVTVSDPYFDGQGPERAGCTFCGGCMTGCRHNAKNSLDKNYLHLAQRQGAEIRAEKRVFDVQPLGAADGSEGYTVHFRSSTGIFSKKERVTAKGVVFAGGVLGTVPLLLRLKKTSLPRMSDRVGCDLRTNNESLIPVTTLNGKKDLAEGLAIGAIVHTDADSHLEPVRYSKGSGFWRWLLLPQAFGGNLLVRLGNMALRVLSEPLAYLKILFVADWAKSTSTLLFMQHLDSTLRMKRGILGLVNTSVQTGAKPSAFIPRAGELSRIYSRLIGGKPTVFFLEPLAGIPSTAHILGGAVMGETAAEGVIDRDNRVFGYENLYVCDGSMISANPGVNPSLSITAISERAMQRISEREREKGGK